MSIESIFNLFVLGCISTALVLLVTKRRDYARYTAIFSTVITIIAVLTSMFVTV